MSESDTDALPIPVQDAEVVAFGPATSTQPVRRVGGASLSAVQAAAVAAGGFVAGAAVLGFVQRRTRTGAALAKGSRRRMLGRRTSGTAAAAQTLQVVSSRTLMVDVHLLGSPGADG